MKTAVDVSFERFLRRDADNPIENAYIQALLGKAMKIANDVSFEKFLRRYADNPIENAYIQALLGKAMKIAIDISLHIGSCIPGQYKVLNNCTNCPVGTYSDTLNAGSCTDCPFGQSSTAGASYCCRTCDTNTASTTYSLNYCTSTSPGACTRTCNTGYVNNGVYCCTKCGTSTDSTLYTRSGCNSSTSPGTCRRSCKSGYYDLDGTCSLCQTCPTNTQSTTYIATGCTDGTSDRTCTPQCNDNYTQSTNAQGVIVCNPGPCVNGTYSASGNAPCSSCEDAACTMTNATGIRSGCGGSSIGTCNYTCNLDSYASSGTAAAPAVCSLCTNAPACTGKSNAIGIRSGCGSGSIGTCSYTCNSTSYASSGTAAAPNVCQLCTNAPACTTKSNSTVTRSGCGSGLIGTCNYTCNSNSYASAGTPDAPTQCKLCTSAPACPAMANATGTRSGCGSGSAGTCSYKCNSNSYASAGTPDAPTVCSVCLSNKFDNGICRPCNTCPATRDFADGVHQGTYYGQSVGGCDGTQDTICGYYCRAGYVYSYNTYTKLYSCTVPCGAGTYKSSPTLAYQEGGTWNTLSYGCTLCPANSSSVSGSTTCTCNPNYVSSGWGSTLSCTSGIVIPTL